MVKAKKRSPFNWIAWAFLLPALISFTLFKYYPILLGIFVSFFNVDILNLPGEFIGLSNYAKAIGDNFFINAVRNNVEFFFVGMLLMFWMPIVLAILINEVRKGKVFMRTMYYLPAIAPGIAMMVLWKYIWQPDFGLANFIMRTFGLSDQLWLNDAKLVKWCMCFPGLVMGGGMNMLIYLAALQDIPEEQHESALMDGAGFIRRIWNISIPQIASIISTMLILSVIWAFNLFDNVQVMTGGGPSGATDTIILYSYKQAYTMQDYGYALSLSTLSFVIIFILTFIQMQLGRDEDASAAKKAAKLEKKQKRTLAEEGN
jgi:multiple sugar transport system permease protein